MNADTKTQADGTISVTVRKLEKKIRAADGTFRTLVSYDGESWQLAANADELHLRFNRAVNLVGNKKITGSDGKRRTWAKEKAKTVDAKAHPWRPAPVTPPAFTEHQSPILGKAVGKKHKYRRNLKRKKERNVKIMRPAHFHNCRGKNHPMSKGETKFICCCARPKRSRFCYGDGKFCIYDKGVSK